MLTFDLEKNGKFKRKPHMKAINVTGGTGLHWIPAEVKLTLEAPRLETLLRHGLASDEQIRLTLEAPRLETTLRARRLLLAARLSSSAPPCLFGMLRSDPGYGVAWIDQLITDMEKMRESGG